MHPTWAASNPKPYLENLAFTEPWRSQNRFLASSQFQLEQSSSPQVGQREVGVFDRETPIFTESWPSSDLRSVSVLLCLRRRHGGRGGHENVGRLRTVQRLNSNINLKPLTPLQVIIFNRRAAALQVERRPRRARGRWAPSIWAAPRWRSPSCQGQAPLSPTRGTDVSAPLNPKP